MVNKEEHKQLIQEYGDITTTARQIPSKSMCDCDDDGNDSFIHDESSNKCLLSEKVTSSSSRKFALCRASQRWRSSVPSLGGSSCDSIGTTSTILPFYEVGTCESRVLSSSSGTISAISSTETESDSSEPHVNMYDASCSSGGLSLSRRHPEIGNDEEVGTTNMGLHLTTTNAPVTPPRHVMKSMLNSRHQGTISKNSPSSVAVTLDDEVTRLREELSKAQTESARLAKENARVTNDMKLLVQSTSELSEHHHQQMVLLRAQLSAEQMERHKIQCKYLKLKVQYFKSMEKDMGNECLAQNKCAAEGSRAAHCERNENPKRTSLTKCQSERLSSDGSSWQMKRQSRRPLISTEANPPCRDHNPEVFSETQKITSTKKKLMEKEENHL